MIGTRVRLTIQKERGGFFFFLSIHPEHQKQPVRGKQGRTSLERKQRTQQLEDWSVEEEEEKGRCSRRRAGVWEREPDRLYTGLDR